MSDWPGMKKAINSTIGTDRFLPLDKLILDNDKLYKNIYKESLSTGLDLFSITNSKKGCIHSIVFPDIKGGSYEVNFIVKVDDNVVFSRKFKVDLSTNYRWSLPLSILNNKNVSFGYSSGNLYLIDVIFPKSVVSDPVILESADSINITNDSYRSRFLRLYKPIEFNEKVEIKLELVNGRFPSDIYTNGYVVYELYD